MSHWVEIDCGKTSYDRELWCWHQRQFVKHFFNSDPSYDYNGSKVHWYFHNKELADTMTTIWSLEEQGYRTSYQSAVRTFFWVDDQYYKKNRKDILAWARLYNCKVPVPEYGWIEVPNDRIEMLFRIVWAGKCYK